MSQSQREGGHKREVLRHMSRSQKKEGRKKKVFRHMSRSQKKEGHELSLIHISHGSFKKLTEEQMETLKKDPLIRETGARLFLGMGTGDAFRKTQVEVCLLYTSCTDVFA